MALLFCLAPYAYSGGWQEGDYWIDISSSLLLQRAATAVDARPFEVAFFGKLLLCR